MFFGIDPGTHGGDFSTLHGVVFDILVERAPRRPCGGLFPFFGLPAAAELAPPDGIAISGFSDPSLLPFSEPGHDH
jgi:hypothetical protein